MDAMRPFFADAVYVNYLGEEGDERVRAAYSRLWLRVSVIVTSQIAAS